MTKNRMQKTEDIRMDIREELIQKAKEIGVRVSPRRRSSFRRILRFYWRKTRSST